MRRALVIIISLFFSACNKNDSQANLFYQEATKIYESNMHNSDSLNRALLLIDSAISMTSTNKSFYYIQCLISKGLKKYSIALGSCRNILRINAKDVYATFTAGILFEQLNNTDSALLYYRMAFNLINDKHAFKNQDMLKDQQKIFLFGLMRDSLNFIRASNEFRIKYSNSPKFNEFYPNILNFNRKVYVSSY